MNAPSADDVELTPPRPPGSVRRTVTIDMAWPGQAGQNLRLVGRVRDAITPAGVARCGPSIAAEVELIADLSGDRQILALDASPRTPGIADLVGGWLGRGFRGRAAELLADERARGDGVHQLVDDLPVAALVSDFALRQWRGFVPIGEALDIRSRRDVTGFCTGFTAGSSALNPDGTSTGDHRTRVVGPLPREDDPAGWHPVSEPTGPAMRRARRIDARVDGSEVIVDAMFQDSSTTPRGERLAVHEYRIEVRADDATGRIRRLEATPTNLPYAECPAATLGIGRLDGTSLTDLRTVVSAELRGTAGCTHLNDAIRGLADVPRLVRLLRRDLRAG